jgi:hypothetical protein
LSPVRRAHDGYLVIADITGYTTFLTGTELEHAQSIIQELTALIRERLVPPLRFVKLEGDAVLCYADSSMIKEGERLVELIEVCYFEFSNLLFNMVRATTCRCAACASIGSLDLKFIAHYGTFVVQRDGTTEDVVGPDVILAHRLLKNSITEQTGVRAYAFFTDACAQQLPARFEMAKQTETIEGFGETSGRVHDLAVVRDEMREARTEFVSADDADYQTTIALRHPPPVVWQYLVDPVQRLRWACVMFNKDPDDYQLNARGRGGAGAKVHCNHGPAEAYREIIDWRPYQYFTTRGVTQFRGGFMPRRPLIETFELTPQGDDGTLLSWRVRLVQQGAFSMLTLRAITLLLRGGIRYGGDKLHAAIRADLAEMSD